MGRRNRLVPEIVLEYRFDRLHSQKLASAYESLVPLHDRALEKEKMKVHNDEKRGDLRTSFLRAAAGSSDDWPLHLRSHWSSPSV